MVTYVAADGAKVSVAAAGSNIRDLFPTPEAYRQFVTDYQDEVKAREHIQKYVWE
jgi:hypothetical protein